MCEGENIKQYNFRVTKDGFTEEMTFGYRAEGSESHVNICKKSTLNRGNSKCKGPEAEVWVVCWRSIEEVCVAGRSEGWEAEDEVKERSRKAGIR